MTSNVRSQFKFFTIIIENTKNRHIPGSFTLLFVSDGLDTVTQLFQLSDVHVVGPFHDSKRPLTFRGLVFTSVLFSEKQIHSKMITTVSFFHQNDAGLTCVRTLHLLEKLVLRLEYKGLY